MRISCLQVDYQENCILCCGSYSENIEKFENWLVSRVCFGIVRQNSSVLCWSFFAYAVQCIHCDVSSTNSSLTICGIVQIFIRNITNAVRKRQKR